MKIARFVNLTVLFSVIFLFISFSLYSAKSSAGETSELKFSSADDFIISDQLKVTFSNQSVKMKPSGISQSWAKTWHDSHFSSSPGDSGAYGVAVDNHDYIYISGLTTNQSGGVDKAFIVKTDQELEEIWYKNDYAPVGATSAVIGRLAFDSGGSLIALCQYILAGQGYSRLLKIDANDGSVIWYKDQIKATSVDWISAWDGSAGPVLDSSDNIYFVVGDGADDTWENGEPMKIFKYSSQGSLVWQVEDNLSLQLNNYYGWDDIWDMEIDSEGGIYIAASADENQSGHHINYGLVKYNSEGNRIWLKIKDFGVDSWQSPRGISIDSSDNIYLDGNLASHGPCGLVKYDKDGNELTALEEGEGDFTAYCWGSKINQFDNWLIAGPFEMGYGIKHRLTANSRYLFSNSYDQKIYIFDKTDLSLVTTISEIKNAWAIYADENYLYVGTYEAERSGVILIYNLSDFSLAKRISSRIIPVKGVISDDNYLYAYAWEGIQVYNKSNFSHQTDLVPSLGDYKSVFADDDFVYAGSTDGVLDVWNKNLSYNRALSAAGTINSIYADSNYIYAGSSNSNIYVWDKADFSLDATLTNSAGDIFSISSDTNYLYVASEDNKVYIFNKSDFSLNSSKTYAYDANSVLSDGDYLYAAIYPYDNNIYVYNKSDFSLYDTISETSNPGIFRFYVDTDLNLDATLSHADPRFGISTHPPRNSIDKQGNFYNVISLKDSNFGNNNSILVVKDGNVYPNTSLESGNVLTLINKNPLPISRDTKGFKANYGIMDEADVKFQLSPNGSEWYFWNGSRWVAANGNQNNTEAEVDNNIANFLNQLNVGQIYVKTYLITDGTKQVDLASLVFSTNNTNISQPLLEILPQTGLSKMLN